MILDSKMTRYGPFYLLFVNIISSCVGLALSQHQIPVVKNEIKLLDVTCDADSFNVTIMLEHPFKGMLSAKDFSQECNTYGTLKDTVTLKLPTYGCGLRLTSKDGKNGHTIMQYSVTLALQQDRHLRQIADQEIHVSCQITDEEFILNSKSMIKEIENILMEDAGRSGRMRQDEIWENQINKNRANLNSKLQETIKSAKAWMEIIPEMSENSYNYIAPDKLQVGEPAKLIVKSTLPVGIGWKVVDCAAQDGLGDSSQKLLDEKGCPIDDQIMPTPIYGPIQDIAFTKYQEAMVVFPAFKFPDRDRLHLTCMLLLCRNACQPIECNQNMTENDRLGKTLIEEEDEIILDQIKIFNSVEVLAPTVNYYKQEYEEPKVSDSSFMFKGLPGDETLCISYHKIALAFCILGMLFLIAVLIATGGLLKARRSGNALSVYTRSIFSSSSGTGSSQSQYGSKLLHDQSSLGFSSAGGMQYGRIL